MMLPSLRFVGSTLLLARIRIARDLLTYQPLEWPETAKAEDELQVTADRRNSAGSNKIHV